MLSNLFIKNKWRDINFPGSYLSAFSFYKELQKKFPKQTPKYKKVLKILQSIPLYQIHALYTDKTFFQHLTNVDGAGLEIQIDLAFMPSFQNFTGFLLAVDPWCNFIYTVPFVSKSQFG